MPAPPLPAPPLTVVPAVFRSSTQHFGAAFPVRIANPSPVDDAAMDLELALWDARQPPWERQ
ncbi:MAG: hypothetical protein U9Q74_10110, partial [Gemmatimonadota bacterium]|nr:hypothetical protein [Gemmatimonadota bacterium]